MFWKQEPFRGLVPIDIYVHDTIAILSYLQLMEESVGRKLDYGYALNYINFYGYVHPDFVPKFKEWAGKMHGYFNEYPPEILASIAEEEAESLVDRL